MDLRRPRYATSLRGVAMGADLTLGASRDLVAAARRLGAKHVRLSPIAAPALPAARISRDERRRALGAYLHDTVVLTVGRLAPQKNLGMVLDIAAAVRDRRPDLRFVVVGDGPEQDALQRRITDERLQVSLLGRSDDIGSLLAAADLHLGSPRISRPGGSAGWRAAGQHAGGWDRGAGRVGGPVSPTWRCRKGG